MYIRCFFVRRERAFNAGLSHDGACVSLLARGPSQGISAAHTGVERSQRSLGQVARESRQARTGEVQPRDPGNYSERRIRDRVRAQCAVARGGRDPDPRSHSDLLPKPRMYCGAAKHCRGRCAGRNFAEKVIVRMKQKMGQAIAKSEQTTGRHWFSRGWDMTPVRNRAHFDYLVTSYLPKHASQENGVVRVR